MLASARENTLNTLTLYVIMSREWSLKIWKLSIKYRVKCRVYTMGAHHLSTVKIGSTFFIWTFCADDSNLEKKKNLEFPSGFSFCMLFDEMKWQVLQQNRDELKRWNEVWYWIEVMHINWMRYWLGYCRCLLLADEIKLYSQTVLVKAINEWRTCIGSITALLNTVLQTDNGQTSPNEILSSHFLLHINKISVSVHKSQGDIEYCLNITITYCSMPLWMFKRR